MNLYIDYSEFELTCWNTDGKGTNVAIPLTEEQAKKICDIIGLLGFEDKRSRREGVRCKRLWRKKKESRRAAQAALIGKIGIVPLPETV